MLFLARSPVDDPFYVAHSWFRHSGPHFAPALDPPFYRPGVPVHGNLAHVALALPRSVTGSAFILPLRSGSPPLAV